MTNVGGIFFADSLVDHLTVLNEAHIFGAWPSYVSQGKINTDLCQNYAPLAGHVPPGP